MRTERCSEQVPGDGPWAYFHMHQCSRKAYITRDGKPYCKQHDPVIKKQKMAERNAKFDAQYNKEREAREQNNACILACEGIKNPEAIKDVIRYAKELIAAYDDDQGEPGHGQFIVLRGALVSLDRPVSSDSNQQRPQ